MRSEASLQVSPRLAGLMAGLTGSIQELQLSSGGQGCQGIQDMHCNEHRLDVLLQASGMECTCHIHRRHTFTAFCAGT